METSNFEKGKLYRDTYNFDEKFTTLFEYVHRKQGSHIFKYISGVNHYMASADGLYKFAIGSELIPHDSE